MSQKTLIHHARYAVTRWSSLASTSPGAISARTPKAKGQLGCSAAKSAERALRERNCEAPKRMASVAGTVNARQFLYLLGLLGVRPLRTLAPNPENGTAATN